MSSNIPDFFKDGYIPPLLSVTKEDASEEQDKEGSD
jgi:hypothetical protein